MSTSTKAAHTPGPWKQAIGPKFGETDIMALHSVTCLATVYVGVNGTDGNANARLIAAAPEMLEALEDSAEALADAHEMATRGPGHSAIAYCPCTSAVAYRHARAALTAARGEA